MHSVEPLRSAFLTLVNAAHAHAATELPLPKPGCKAKMCLLHTLGTNGTRMLHTVPAKLLLTGNN